MQLVINISDYDMEYINNAHDIPKDISLSIAEAILDGKVIPPHGRLIDADETIRIWEGTTFEGSIKPLIDARPTVIEAEGNEE